MRRRLKLLRRRQAFLADRVTFKKRRLLEHGHDEAEIAALEWVCGLGDRELSRLEREAYDKQVEALVADAKGG